MAHNIKPGVATGDQVQNFLIMLRKGFALAVNVTGSNTVNCVLETAAKLNAPVIIQFSMVEHNSTLEGLSNAGEKAAIAGGIAGVHIHSLAEAYRQP
jgi:fructose-bisphosphate aldolase class II